MLVATFQDADPAGTPSDYSATVAWGDGTTSTTGAGNVTIVPDAKKPGVFDVRAEKATPYTEDARHLPFSVTVSDIGGASITKNAAVNVADAPLALTLSPPVFIKNVAVNQVQVGTFIDPGTSGGDPSIYSVTVAWGDGQTSTTAAGNVTVQADGSIPNGFDILATKANPYTTLANNLKFQITVTDAGGATVTQTAKVNIAPVSLTVQPPSPTEGQAISNLEVATFTNAADFAGNVSIYSATVSWGDGQVTKDARIQEDPIFTNLFSVIASKPTPYSDSARPLTFTVSVAENALGGPYVASASKAITIADAPLSLTLVPPTAVAEGVAATRVLVATFTDPCRDHVVRRGAAAVPIETSGSFSQGEMVERVRRGAAAVPIETSGLESQSNGHPSAKRCRRGAD